jgi:transglutaminase-like putative cysteine protease
MTATMNRPAAPGRAPSPRPRRGSASDGQLLAYATLVVATGVFLTLLPLRSVFTDWTWLAAAVASAVPYLGVVAAFRWRGSSRVSPVLLGLLASALVMAWLFVPEHLALGVIPTPSSVDDIRALLTSAHESMQNERAPVPSTDGLRLITSAAAVALVALTDVLAILWRKPLLASAPLLEVLAVASATSGDPARPALFALAAIGFLVILVAGTRLQDRDWGPSVDGSAGRLGGARAIAVAGIVAALVVPLGLPSVSHNLLASATHHKATVDSTSANGARIELATTADLAGSLRRGTPVDLLRVQVDPGAQPFYLRQAVLNQFGPSGWTVSTNDTVKDSSVRDNRYPIAPGSRTGIASASTVVKMHAQFTVLALAGATLPILGNPTELNSAGNRAVWDDATATVNRATLKPNRGYGEQVVQPAPTTAELRAAPDVDPNAGNMKDYLELPGPLSESVRNLVASLTAGTTNSYDKARAIAQYFTNPANKFSYALNTKPVDGLSALDAFLTTRSGYCQQYAAAAGALMRQAGLPARVVLGYTHQTPDATGTFTVTTADAHAWVEVYFSGVGWVPFDPTPLAGADAARTVVLPWAPHTTDGPSVGSTTAAPASTSANPNQVPERFTGDATVGPIATGGTGTSTVAGIGIALAAIVGLLLLVASPRMLRTRQRRRRLARSLSSGDPEPLWEELAATAADRGALWPDTVTVGQVPSWLTERGLDDRGRAAVTSVAGRVERARYSAGAGGGDVDDATITGVEAALKRWARRAERRERLLAWWFPRSLLSRADSRRR